MATRHGPFWMLALALLVASAADANRDPHGGFLPDRAYARLSSLPLDSLSDREYDALIRERELRLSFTAAVFGQAGWGIARPWPSRWVGLLSDSAYAALSARPLESLSAREYDLLMRERQLRALRSPRHKGHAILMTDATYAALSSAPIESLTARQYDLLMRERQLRAPRPPDPSETHLLGFAVFVAAVGGFAAAAWILGSALAHAP